MTIHLLPFLHRYVWIRHKYLLTPKMKHRLIFIPSYLFHQCICYLSMFLLILIADNTCVKRNENIVKKYKKKFCIRKQIGRKLAGFSFITNHRVNLHTSSYVSLWSFGVSTLQINFLYRCPMLKYLIFAIFLILRLAVNINLTYIYKINHIHVCIYIYNYLWKTNEPDTQFIKFPYILFERSQSVFITSILLSSLNALKQTNTCFPTAMLHVRFYIAVSE